MQGPSGWLIVAGQIIIEGSNEGLFVYNGTPSLGNGPIFWISPGTTDPSGNTITPTAGVAGTGQFNAGNTIINSSGIFIYSSAPAAGNLIGSVTPATGVDAYGNNYLQGIGSYQSAFANAMIGGAVIFYHGSLSGGWIFGGQVLIDSSGDMFLQANGDIYANGNLIS